MSGAQKQKNIGGLCDDLVTGFQERWREGRMLCVLHEPRHLGQAACLARHIDIVGGRFFQRQAYKLAAPLDVRPVVELVAHAALPLRGLATTSAPDELRLASCYGIESGWIGAAHAIREPERIVR